MAFSFSVKFDSKGLESSLMDKFGPGSPAQRFWDETVFNGSVKYMPMVTGNFVNLSRMATKFGSGELVYPGPYAHYLWVGKKYVDPQTGKAAFFSPDYGFWSRPGVSKVPTDEDLEFNKEAHDLAGPRWVERAALDNKTAWIESMQKFVDGGMK